MPKTIWNEGRVLGLTAYELYAKYVISTGGTPSDEKSWLASTLSYGASMLLWVSPDNVDGEHYRDFAFPTGCNLGASNTIMASFFSGEGSLEAVGAIWARKVINYGPLIENDSVASPTAGEVTDMEDIPVLNNGELDDVTITRIQDYAKITDGIIVQPGTWSVYDNAPPQKKFIPKLTEVPTLRMAFSDKIEHGFWLLLSGFIDRNISLGMTSQNPSVETDHPESGDFLGPAVFPWAAKVVFSIPPALMSYIESVKIETEDIAALYMYNTRYLWFYGGSGIPTQTTLANTKTINGIRAVAGHVSDAFVEDFCVDYETAVAACASGHIGDGMNMQKVYIDQIVAKYGTVEVEGHQTTPNFRYFFQSYASSVDAPSQNGMFYPVDIRTNSILFGTTRVCEINADRGINLSAADITVEGITIPHVDTDIMGSYWDSPTPTVPTYTQPTDDPNVPAYEDHPLLYNVVRDIELFWKPYTGVPKAPSSFNGQFVQWFSSMPVQSVITENSLVMMGIHADYHNIDFQSFIQYAATGRDMTMPMSSVKIDTKTNVDMYLYAADDIEAIADPNFTWAGNTKYAVDLARAEMSSIDFYRMAEIRIYEVTQGTIGDDVTSTYANTSYHTWVASAKSRKNQTKAVSLIDNIGSPLPTAGTGGTIDTDYIRWNDLLEALNMNRQIDILAGLRNLKNSTSTYIQLDDTRLYVASTAPTGDIPEGSVGIGFGGVQIYTSGAWTPST